MSAFTKTTTQTSSQVEQKSFVVPTINGRWKRVSRDTQQQGRYQRRPHQQGRYQRRPQQQGRQQRRPPLKGRQQRRPYNNRRRHYRKKQLTPQKGTKIATGSLLDMAMIKNKDGSKSVKVQSRRNGKRVIKHASLNQVLTKKDVKDSNNCFSVLEQEDTVRKIVPRPAVINTVAAPQGKWGAPLSSAVKEDGEFKYEAGSELEKQHLERLAQLEEEKLAQQEIDRQIRTGEYKVDSWADEMDSDEDEDDFQDNRKLGEGYEETDDYDYSCQPDVDDDYYEAYWDARDEDEEHYNHQAEIAQMDGWYD